MPRRKVPPLPARAGDVQSFGRVGGLRITRFAMDKAVGCEFCSKSGQLGVHVAGWPLWTDRIGRFDPRLRVCATHALEMAKTWEKYCVRG
jgi:hypothetical protein